MHEVKMDKKQGKFSSRRPSYGVKKRKYRGNQYSEADHCDNARVKQADQRSSFSSKSARISRREARAAEDELFDQEEGIMYGPGIAD